MKFNVLVMSIDNVRSKAIVAHNLAGNRGVSLQHALSLLENLPVIYQVNLPKEDADAVIARLGKIGVKANAVPREMLTDTARENKIKETVKKGLEIVSPQPAPPDAADNAPRPHFTNLSGVLPGTEPRVRDRRRNFKIKAIATAACFIGLIFICAKVKHTFFLPASSASNAAPGNAKQKPGPRVDSMQKTGQADRDRLRQPRAPADERVRQAAEYSDSARACVNVNGAIAFYKLAISFNKNNMDAWYGLINAYTIAQMPEDADKARVEMKKIFGDGVLSLAQIVRRYGDLLDMYSTEDGAYRIEYRSRQTGQAELLHETFLLIKAFGVQCDCAALSLFAHTDKNKGVLVYVKTDPLPVSYPDFIARANVTYLK